MSALRHLHPEEFKGYVPAQIEGKAASDWLSTDEGHAWQDEKAKGRGSYAGLSSAPWISLKPDTHTINNFGDDPDGNFVAGWFPNSRGM